MTRSTNARVAGVTFLLYIGFGLLAMALTGEPSGGAASAAALDGVAAHPTGHRVAVVLSLLMGMAAMVLGVTMRAITRDEDGEVATLGLLCRVGEGVLGAFPITSLGLLWLSGAPTAIADTGTSQAVAALLVRVGGWQTTVCAFLFAVGSTLFCWLLLRGRVIPVSLAWLGVAASVLLVVTLPLQLAGVFRGGAAQLVWAPMALFEIPLALWLIVRGVPPARLAPMAPIG